MEIERKTIKLGVPDGRKFEQVNVVCGHIVHMCGWKERKRGRWGLKMGQLTLSMGPARVEVSSYTQTTTIPSKRDILYIKH
jgi:hypothetical protein